MGGCGCGSKNVFERPIQTTTLTLSEFSELQEKGRRRALDMMRWNPAARKRVEKQFGLEYCQRRYPELYGLDQAPDYAEPAGAPALDVPPITFKFY